MDNHHIDKKIRKNINNGYHLNLLLKNNSI